jgi:hypothetical protein
LGVPLSAVRSVCDYQPPMPLPGAAPWLSGVLPAEGEVWPVLSQGYWGSAASVPQVCVVLVHRRRALVLVGEKPEVHRGNGPVAPMKSTADGGFDAPPSGGGEVVWLDVPQLYSALGLVYNEAG